jgi:hypothetical protein
MSAIEIMIQVIAMLFAAGAIYGAIKADLKNMHEKIADNKEDIKVVRGDVDKAHERIDSILTEHSFRKTNR